MTLSQLQNPWTVDADQFPAQESPTAKWHFLLNYAVLAPSIYNTQPWLFRISGDELELYKDRSRNLAVLDPEQRELIVSCGASLSFLETAVRHFGYRANISTFPEIGKADLLARVQLRYGNGASSFTHARFNAVKQSEINLFAFDPASSVPAEVQSRVADLVADRGVEARWIHSAPRKEFVAGLINRANDAQRVDGKLISEWRDWMHPVHCEQYDGMPMCQLRLDENWLDPSPFITRTFATEDGQPAAGAEILNGTGAYLVLGISRDNPVSWLSVGQAMGDAILELRAAGWQTSFLNQPVEIPAFKEELAQFTQLNSPQILMRVGGGKPSRPLPRRPVHRILFNPYREHGSTLGT